MSSLAAKTRHSRYPPKAAGAWALSALALTAGWLDFHVLFGLLLLSSVAIDFRQRMHGPAFSHPAEVRDFSRTVGRRIYLLLYLIVGAKQLAGYVPGIAAKPPRDLQILLAYGIAAIAVNRILAAWVALNCADSVVRDEVALQGMKKLGEVVANRRH